MDSDSYRHGISLREVFPVSFIYGCKEACAMKAVIRRKVFGSEAVMQNRFFDIPDGKCTAITGPSGSGKTTLMRILAGLDHDFDGYIENPAEKAMILFQEDRLSSTMSAFSNVYYALGGSCDKAAIIEAFNDLGLDEPYKKIREYSGGMKRRVSLIRAMLADSDMVLLDEPFTGLDARSIFLACSFIKAHQKGRTIILVTHENSPLPADGCIEL